MKLQIQRIIISLQFSLCITLTLTTANDFSHRNNYNNITYQFGTQSTSTSSTLRPIVERVFSRKKRFLLVPPGGSLKFTANIGKRIVSAYPRGFSFVFEAASYYEGFATPSDLIPKWLRSPTTTTPKPKEPTTPIYVYIPGIGLRYKARPAIRPQKVQRIDVADDTAFQWVDDPNKIDYVDPANWRQYGKYDSNDYQAGYYDWTAAEVKPQQQLWSPLEENAIYQEPLDFYGTEAYTPPSLHQYHGHRDRRQLFENLEAFSKILGYDMKSCVLRAICECKILLLPPGYSMLQDMMRVILTMPVHRSTNDEYTHATGDSAESCEQQYHQKCPISFLNWILNPVKPIRR